jgi:hypothetical protein
VPFGQLVKETGLPEADVRAVVDRFRRDDCSFLVPSFAEDRPLAPGDVVDIGHEALIRRWTRVNREEAGARAGWLWDEAADGRIYRGLLTLIDGHTGWGRPALPFNQLRSRLRWWRQRPRTAEWAERHEGRFAEVERLLAHSRRVGWLGRGALALVAFAFVAGTFYVLHSWRQAEQSANDLKAALIWSRLDFGRTDDPRSQATVQALWDLAVERPTVRDAFLRLLPQHEYHVTTLSEGPRAILRAFGLRPAAQDVARLLAPILAALPKTADPRALHALAGAVAALGPTPGQAQAALAPVLAALPKTDDPGALAALAGAAAALGPTPGQAQAALTSVLAALPKTAHPYVLAELARAAATLGPRLAPEQVGSALETLKVLLAKADVPYAADAFATAIVATLPSGLTEEAYVTAVVDLLKWPTTVGAATDALLDALKKRVPGAPGKEAGLDATVRWVAANFPRVDLESPPTFPASGSTGGAW